MGPGIIEADPIAFPPDLPSKYCVSHRPTSLSISMSLRTAARRTFLSVSPTTSTVSSAGVPLARGLNLAASSPHDGHGHGASEARTDFGIPKFAGRSEVGALGVVSRSRLIGELTLSNRLLAFFFWVRCDWFSGSG